MKLYNTVNGIVIESNDKLYLIKENWNNFINDDAVLKKATAAIVTATAVDKTAIEQMYYPPLATNQELWACGVTYYRSMVGRQEESKAAGGADFYGKVYEAERPECFF